MVHPDGGLHTQWLSSRKNSVLRCVERYSAAAASEYRRALRKVQEVEETMAQVGTETGPHGTASQPAARLQSGEVEALNRRLSAANAEIRRYQTRLFACEREVVALRQENAELEALCDQARKNELLPPKTPQPPVLDQPGLPVIVFPGQAAQETALPEAAPQSTPAPQAAEPAPAPKAAEVPEPEEVRESPFAQKDWKPTTRLDYLSVDIVHQLEALMG